MNEENKITLFSRHLIDYELNGKKGYIPYNCLKTYVDWANKIDIEYISTEIVDDKIIFALNSHSGQAGLLGAWDTKEKKLVHLTDEPYIYKTMKIEDKLVSLKRIAYWGHPESYDLDEIEFGIIDINKTSTTVKKDIPFKPKKGKLTIDYKETTLVFDVNDE